MRGKASLLMPAENVSRILAKLINQVESVLLFTGQFGNEANGLNEFGSVHRQPLKDEDNVRKKSRYL